MHSADLSTTSVPSCNGCGQLREEFGVALKSLSDGDHSKYGDLLRENFALKQKVKIIIYNCYFVMYVAFSSFGCVYLQLGETEREFAQAKKEALDEFERITLYMQDYKSKSSEKVAFVCMKFNSLC